MLVTVYCCNNHPITRGRHMWLVDTESEARYLEGNTSPDPIGVGYDGLFVCPHCNRDGTVTYIHGDGETFLRERRTRYESQRAVNSYLARQHTLREIRVRNNNPSTQEAIICEGNLSYSCSNSEAIIRIHECR